MEKKIKRYLIVSPVGLGLFLVPRISAERIYFWTPGSDMQLGKNLNEVEGWEKLHLLKDFAHPLNHVLEPEGNKFSGHIPTTDDKSDLIIIFDDNGYGELADYLKGEGFQVIGGGRFDDRMESDRVYAMEFMKKFMKVPEYYAFESFQEGLGFLKGQPKEARWIFKPNDNKVPKEMTYVSKDVPDLVRTMEGFKADWQWKESFILQIFVPGIEVDFNAYFNGKDWMEDSLMIYFENKPLGNGDKGPATGGSLAVQFPRPLKGVFFDILDKVRPYLERVKFRGVFAVNSIVSEDGHEPYFLELTPRFGYPSLPLDVTLLEEKGKTVDDFFTALVTGDKSSFFPTDKVGVTVSLFKMPYPDVKGYSKNSGVPYSWDKKWDRYFFPYYVMGKKGKMVLSGDSGWVGQTTCCDSTLDGATSMLYDTYMPTLNLTDVYFRTDLGVDAKRRVTTLRDWGLL